MLIQHLPGSRHLICWIYSIPTSPFTKEALLLPFYIRGNRLREGKSYLQGHRPRKWWNKDLHPIPTPKPLLIPLSQVVSLEGRQPGFSQWKSFYPKSGCPLPASAFCSVAWLLITIFWKPSPGLHPPPRAPIRLVILVQCDPTS